MRTEILPILFPFALSLALADNVPPSRINPGNFPVAKVPQFLCIGSDDNYYASGVKFFLDAMQNKRNKEQAPPQDATFDGAYARMSFYVNTNNGGGNDLTGNNTIGGYLKQGLADGFELGDHTRTHATSSTTSLSTWNSEIQAVVNDFGKMSINKMAVTGFRTPYLAYNDFTFAALASNKFLYDCSINTGHDAESDGTNFVWPYTLDGGPFGPDVAGEPAGVHVGAHPGLWEVPVYGAIVPPALRHQVWLHHTQKVNNTTYTAVFDTTTGKVTGMDYNMLSGPSNYGGLGLDSAEYASTLKHTLDLHLQGNRAPMTFAVHSNIFYDQNGWNDEGSTAYNGAGAKSPKTTVTQARGAVADFLNYALSKPEVRVVTAENLVKWCAHPVAFSSAVGARPIDAVAGRDVSIRVAAGKIIVTGLREGAAGSLSLVTLSGREAAHVSVRGRSFSWRPEKIDPGPYLLHLQAPGLSKNLFIAL
jgi:hypothetical protein